jgi:serine/threonine-protein kinase Chk2
VLQTQGERASATHSQLAIGLTTFSDSSANRFVDAGQLQQFLRCPLRSHASISDLIADSNSFPLSPSANMDGYKLHEPLESGPANAVYRCTNCQGVPMFAKVYPKTNSAKPVYFNELSILQSIMSSLVVKCVDSFETDESYFLVLEDGGKTLYDWRSARNSVGYETFHRLVLRMFEAVKHVHDADIVHGDIKLENFVVDNSERVRLIDFGLSERLPPKSGLSSKRCGSDNYRAPELIQELPHDKSIDIWALGVTIAALGTGEFPFTAEDAFLHAIDVITAPPILDSVKAQFGEDLVDLIEAMLAKEPSDRPTIDECLTHRWCIENSR